jgi:hypothetical protein
MNPMTFERSLLLAPLVYAIHHAEEHLLFNFREWRLRYFPDNNALSTEAIFAVIISVTMIYLLLHATLRTRTSALMCIFWLMALQTQNVVFHLGSSIVFWDFSPGLITALALYLPANMLIYHTAIKDGLVSKRQMGILFLMGGLAFWGFELVGPAVLLAGVATTWGLVLLAAYKNRSLMRTGMSS